VPGRGGFPAQLPAAHSPEGGGASAGQAEMAAATGAPGLVNFFPVGGLISGGSNSNVDPLTVSTTVLHIRLCCRSCGPECRVVLTVEEFG
jgi:hypothetical protein